MKKFIIMIGLACTLSFMSVFTPAAASNDFGNTVQITTNLRSFSEKPSWLLIIRDIDHNQVLPYLYDFTEEDNFWIALTYSRNFVVTVSELSFSPSGRKIHNFCNLESMGAIQHGSISVNITGKLTPRAYTSNCQVLKYSGSNFNIASPQ